MPGVLQLVQVTKVPAKIQTWLAPNESFLLVNPDITNAIYIGNDPGSQLIAVPPLGSIALEGTPGHDTWVSTNSGNYIVNAYLMPGGSNWTPSPAQVAAQISALGLATATNQVTGNNAINTVNTTLGTPAQNATVAGVTTAVNGTPQSTAALIASGNAGGTPGGVPLLRFTNTLSRNTFSIGAGATQVLVTNASVNQPGYEGYITVNLPATSGTLPFCTLMFQWIDSASGLALDTENFVLSSGNGPSNAIGYYISGPCRGDQVTISLKNNDPGFTLTATYAVNQTSHMYVHDRILQTSYPATAPNGFSWPAGIPTSGVLCESQPSVGAGATVTRLCAVWSGIVWANIEGGGLSGGTVLSFTDASGLLSGSVLAEPGVLVAAAGARQMQQLVFPSGPMLINIHNSGSASTTPLITVTKQEY